VSKLFPMIKKSLNSSGRTKLILLDQSVGSDYVQIWDDYFIWTGDTEEPPTIKYFNKGNGNKEWEYIHQW
jgi:hypothetical protein